MGAFIILVAHWGGDWSLTLTALGLLIALRGGVIWDAVLVPVGTWFLKEE